MSSANAFCYVNVAGENLSPEEIGESCGAALDIARGVHGICELAVANLNGGKVDCESDTLFRVIHAAMEKAIEIGNHLYYEREYTQEKLEGEIKYWDTARPSTAREVKS